MVDASRQQVLAGFDVSPPPEPSNQSAGSAPAAGPGEPDAPGTLNGQVVFVVDAHSLIYQVFHALPEMSGPQGQPVGAIHGFLRDMADLLENQRPDYLFCAFDAPGDTFRHEIYPPYKETRQQMPQDLVGQIPNIHRLLEALGIATLECTGYEADDILATLARQTEQRGGQCVLVTGDKDCRQLLSEQTRIYNIRKNELFDVASLQEKWGVRPEQVADFLALMGDSVDNVPGVPLIGPKIAQQLLQQYGTLENVLDHAEEVSGKKRRENLIQGRTQALLSRRLVQLDRQMPIQVDWQAGRVGGAHTDQVRKLCQEFGFRQLGDRLVRLATGTSPKPVWVADYRMVATPAELQQLVQDLSDQPRVAIDTETTSTSARRAEIVGYSFAWRDGQACYVPVRAPEGQPCLDPLAVREALRPILENPAIAKVGQNLKYDIVVLRSAGIDLQGAAFDTMVADYLLDPGQRNHGLDDLSERYLNHTKIKIQELIGTGRQQRRMDQVPVSEVTRYAAEDADVPWRLSRILQRKLSEQGLERLFHELEMPLVQVLAEMEFHGIKVDIQRLGELSGQFGHWMAQLEDEIYQLAGGPFPIDSRLQLSRVLFEELALPVVKRTKTGPSTDAEVLGQLALQHPLPAKVLQYRQYAKLKSTYVDALPALVHPQTGRLHTSFKQDVTATGRLSSQDPNLQNIPIRSQAGREIRSAFLPGPPGWQLLAADYSQIELRVLAHYAGDPALKQAFDQDQDIHTRVASEVSGVPPAEVTQAMRRQAKAINFGILYGQSPFGLARILGIEKQDAALFIDAYFARYPGVEKFIQQTLEQCRQTGYVSTILGRRRSIQGIRDPSQRNDPRQRNLPERIAINTIIQGSAADLIKQAMITIAGRLRQEKLAARMLLQIHDELIFEVPAEELAALAALVTEEMGGAGKLDVPLKVDVKTGTNWAQCEPWGQPNGQESSDQGPVELLPSAPENPAL